MRTATTSRRRYATRRRARCRICGAYESRRFCPAVNTQVCPFCCADMRGTRDECQACRYNLVSSVRSREIPSPELKFRAALVSDSERTGMAELAIAWEKPNGRLKAMFLLLDFWKKGLKDCFVDVDISKEEFEHRCKSMAGSEAKKISLDDAKKLIKRARHISNAVRMPIPWDYTHWQYLLGDMSHIPDPPGSIYKCARCGAELNDRVVEVVKRHAQLEDAHFYMVCERCAGEFED